MFGKLMDIRTLVAAFDPAKAMLNGAYLYDCQLRDTSEYRSRRPDLTQWTK